MKIFNLTDVETPALNQRGLVNHSFAVGDKMISPGAVEDVDDETFARVQGSVQELVSFGALACGDLPDVYKALKAQQEKASDPSPAPSDGFDEAAPRKAKKA